MSYKLTLKDNIAYHSIRIVGLNTFYAVFIALSAIWSLSKVIAEKLLITFHDLKWPWRHGEGSLVAIFRLRVSLGAEYPPCVTLPNIWTWSLAVTRCLRMFPMVFFQKRRLSFFPHWLIMERSQNWPDLWSSISKFWDIHFIDTVTAINHWKF